MSEKLNETSPETVEAETTELTETAEETKVAESTEIAEETKEAELTETAEETAEEKQLTAPSLEEVEHELNIEKKKSRQNKIFKRIAFILIVVAAVAVIMAVLVTPVLQVSGNSMTDTLQDGDVIVTLKDSKFETGDVVAFYYNNAIMVKRVIATAGDWVDIDEDGTVYINNVELDEPYITEKALGECNIDLPYQVPEGKIFVMGDHRATSIDSRNTAVGCVNIDDVSGKLIFRVWPLSGFGIIK